MPHIQIHRKDIVLIVDTELITESVSFRDPDEHVLETNIKSFQHIENRYEKSLIIQCIIGYRRMEFIDNSMIIHSR